MPEVRGYAGGSSDRGVMQPFLRLFERSKRDNPPMARYVFFPDNMPGTKSIAAAKRVLIDQGASIVGTAEGGVLVEATSAEVKRVAQALRGWDYAPERAETRVPERRPLERARLLAGKRTT